MANLSQAMKWLAAGRKVTTKSWIPKIYLYIEDNLIKCKNGYVVFPDHNDWELYEEAALLPRIACVRPPSDPLIEDRDYQVWSEDGNTRTFAYWLNDHFYGLYDRHSMPLQVGRYKLLPTYEEVA